MRKVIKGRTYNTETSKEVGCWSNGLSGGDFGRCEETLYVNTKGAYFLYGEGGALSKYSQPAGDMKGPGREIVPLSMEQAQEWAEEHLTADEYEAEFGECEEADGDLVNRERVNLSLSHETISKLRELSQDTGVPMSRMIDRLVSEHL